MKRKFHIPFLEEGDRVIALSYWADLMYTDQKSPRVVWSLVSVGSNTSEPQLPIVCNSFVCKLSVGRTYWSSLAISCVI